ncbi:DsbA family oxidoreductase [Micromonospora auratinigra]|uniref:Predicted dithiol-disulfide isomerase, DsbA family n=1 Tax=Micromonospora auratinigra TaxID=261654 RepID=A0A1A8ZFZ4_9ACTN|nr:DsbA family oxidoreductase [Micromonospora auratinigra]SBT42933.1 Predicted dithiol-disulfide isomerase, DsbA family [Micromonospora auratinigra]
MLIDVWADVTCPWCYLGKRRLERALAAFRADGGPEATVAWRPYQLNPAAPAGGAPLDAAALAAYGVHHDATSQAGYVAEVAAGAGPGFRWGPAWRVNTFDAHRLLALARRQGGAPAQGVLMERLLRAHFGEGANLGDHAVLAGLATEAGVTCAAAALADGTAAAQVRAELAEGLAIGVRAVPTFVVAGRAVGGAQPPEVLLDLLRRGRDADRPETVAVYAGDDEPTSLRHAEALLDGNDPLNALRVLGPLLDRHGDDPALRLLAARAYFGSAQLGRARATLEALVVDRPVDDYARFLLGRVAERQSRPAEARSHYRLAVAMCGRPAYREALDRVTGRLRVPA